MARTVTSTSYRQTGQVVAAQLWNSGVKGYSDFMSNKPSCKLLSGVGQSVANNAWTAVQFDGGKLDTDGGHSSVVNNSRYTCQVAGWYWVKGASSFALATNATNRIDTALAKNGSIWVGSATFMYRLVSDYSAFTASALVQMAVGDYVELWVRQLSGAALSLDSGSTLITPGLTAFFISK